MEHDETIARLIDVHGEDGLSHSADGWRRILEVGRERPVRVVNVLAFHDECVVDGQQTTGREAYSSYLAANTAPFGRVGGRLIASEEVFDAISYRADRDWHMYVVTEYPTGDALASMWLDPEFVAAHHHREAGVRRSIAAFSAVTHTR